jgi:predicted glycoside hydrolase/deacetylase ChbG (UPF0249 family)
MILCADDYALTPAVSRGIRSLAERGRVSAISCMVVTSAWAADGPRLAPLEKNVDLGLHLTLTEGTPLTPGVPTASLRQLWTRAARGQIDSQGVRREIDAQLDVFESVLGQPAFIDGHHHVHQLPGIRELVVGRVFERYGSNAWIRNSGERASLVARRNPTSLRAWALAATGRRMGALLRDRGVPTNVGFAGAYDWSGSAAFEQLFPRLVRSAGPKTVVMCHPGEVDATSDARPGELRRREEELRYFGSSSFGELLRRVPLTRARDVF